MWDWRRSCWAAEAEKRKSRKCGVDKHAFMRYNQPCVCGRSSSGRARPCQGRGSEFEPRRPLHKKQGYPLGGLVFCGIESGEARNELRLRTARRDVEAGSNSPGDCCVRERRAEPRTESWRCRTVEKRTFACSSTRSLLRYGAAAPQAAIKKDTPSGRMGYLFAVQLRPSFSSDGGGSCRRCGYPPAR